MADKKEELVPAEPPPSYEAAAQTTMVRPRMRGPPPPLELPALTALRGKRVILASASPRRRQLLAHVRTAFSFIVSQSEHLAAAAAAAAAAKASAFGRATVVVPIMVRDGNRDDIKYARPPPLPPPFL